MTNEQERAACCASDVSSCVVACPGSGKTTTVIGRIKYLVQQEQVTSVALITFTNAAADEMERRLGESGLSLELLRKVKWVGTIHALALKLLRESQGVWIADDEVIDYVLDSIPCAGKRPAREEIMRHLVRLASHPDWKESVRNGSLTPVKVLALTLMHRLEQAGLVPLEAMVARAAADSRLAGRFTHVVLDEAQDCDDNDFIFVEHVGQAFTAVGDPDQSIYGFRGAITKPFRDRMRVVECFELSRTFRFGVNVAKFAWVVMGRPIHPNDHDDSAEIVEFSDPEKEVAAVRERVDDAVRRGWSWAVLCRTNAERIDWSNRTGLKSTWTEPNVDNDSPFTRWDSVLMALHRASLNWTLVEILLACQSRRNDIREIVLKAQADGKTPESLLGFDPANWEAVSARLTHRAREFLRSQRDHESAVTLQDKSECRKNAVMTIHAAKGLEFDLVILPGMLDSSIPARRRDLDEERRILYVAVTRAKRSLVVTWCRKPGTFDKASRFLA